MLKAVLKIYSSNLNMTVANMRAFIVTLEKKDNVHVLGKFVTDSMKIMNDKDKANVNILIALNIIASTYPEYIDKVIKDDLIKWMPSIYLSKRNNLTLLFLVRAIGDLELYDSYIRYSEDISWFSSRGGDEGIANFNNVIELMKRPQILLKTIDMMNKGKMGWNHITNYDSRDYNNKITEMKKRFFLTILKTYKTNKGKFSNIKKSDKLNSLKGNAKGIYEEIIVLIEMIEVHRLRPEFSPKTQQEMYEAIALMPLFSDNPDEILKELEGSYVSRIIMDLLYMTKDEREKYKTLPGITSTTITTEVISEWNDFKNKESVNIINEIFSGKIEFHDLSYYVDYIIKNRKDVSLLIELFNSNDFSNKTKLAGNILYTLNKTHPDVAFDLFKESSFSYISQDAILAFRSKCNKTDSKMLIKSFNSQKFEYRKTYSDQIFINTFEGRFINLISNLFVVDNTYLKEELLQALGELNIRNNVFQAYVDAYNYILGDTDIVKETKDNNYIILFIEIINTKFTLSKKLLLPGYIQILRRYLEIVIKDEYQMEYRDTLNSILYMIRNLDWEQLKTIISLLDDASNDKFSIWRTIFRKEYKIEKSPSWKYFSESKYYKNNLKNFSESVVQGWFYDFENQKKYWVDYSLNYAIHFIKNDIYEIEPYEFHSLLRFCKDQDFTNSEVMKAISMLKKANPGEMNQGINAIGERNMFPYLIETLNRAELEEFAQDIRIKGIPFPSELS